MTLPSSEGFSAKDLKEIIKHLHTLTSLGLIDWWYKDIEENGIILGGVWNEYFFELGCWVVLTREEGILAVSAPLKSEELKSPVIFSSLPNTQNLLTFVPVYRLVVRNGYEDGEIVAVAVGTDPTHRIPYDFHKELSDLYATVMNTQLLPKTDRAVKDLLADLENEVNLYTSKEGKESNETTEGKP